MKKINNAQKEYQAVYNTLKSLDIVNKSVLPVVAVGTAASIGLGPISIIASATISGSAVLISQALVKNTSSLHQRYASLQRSTKLDETKKQNLSDLMNRLQNKKRTVKAVV